MKNQFHTIVLLLLTAGTATTVAEDQTAPRPTGQAQAAKSANAQLPSRVFIDVNGGYRFGTLTFGETHTDLYFTENKSWTADYEVKSAPTFDVGGGVRVWRNLVASVAYSQFRDTRAASVIGEIPHPFFFDQNRSISGISEPLKHEEQTIHVSALWSVPMSRGLELGVFGGPSFLAVKRSFVGNVVFDDIYPFETATFTRAIVQDVKQNTVGFNAGADVAWLFSRHVGVGATVRYVRASTDFAAPAGGSVSVNLGGVQTTAGLRIRLGGRSAAPRRGERTSRPATERPNANAASPGEARPPEARSPESEGRAADRSKTGSAATAITRPDRKDATVNISSGIFVVPDATRTPLRVLEPGTRIKVLEATEEWLQVEFRDPQWGPRVGYVLRGNCTY